MMVRNASNKAVIVDVLHLSVVRLAAAVHETLIPFMTEMREDLAEDDKSQRPKPPLENSSSPPQDTCPPPTEAVCPPPNPPSLCECGGCCGWRKVAYHNLSDTRYTCMSCRVAPYSFSNQGVWPGVKRRKDMRFSKV